MYPYGKPDFFGLIKQTPEDFIVTENLGFEPSGSGEHLFLFIEKINQTTQEIIQQLSRGYDIRERDIGYSGLKDRQAITRQWFSLYLPGKMKNLQKVELQSCKILQSSWHDKKLRPGTHKSNDFEIVVSQLSGDDSKFTDQLQQVETSGFANYFGQQRFGSQQNNVDKGLQILTSPHKSKRLTRSRKSIYLSALRSYLFNQILSKRISHGIWLQPAEGDVFMLKGTHSIFTEHLNQEILERYQSGDISSTASLFGSGESKLTELALEMEQDVFNASQNITACLKIHKAKLQMRSCREFVQNLQVDCDSGNTKLKLKVRLPSGAYLTTLLSHFLSFN